MKTILWKRRMRAFARQVAAPTVSEVAATSVRVSWAVVQNATQYVLQRARSGSATWTDVHTTATGLFYVDQGLTASTGYLYRVGVTSPRGVVAYSPETLVTTSAGSTNPPPSSTPTSGPNPVSVGPTSVDLSMPVMTGATRYVLQRATGATTTGLVESPAGSGLYAPGSLAELAPGLYATTGLVEDPTTPGLYLTTTTTIVWATVYDGPATTFKDQNLTPSTAYQYRYAVVTGSGTSGWSPVTPVTTSAATVTAPATPTAAPAASAITSDGVTLTLTPVAGAVTYTIQRSLTSTPGTGYTTVYSNTYESNTTGTYATVYSGTGLTFTDTQLASATTYYYRYQATNAAGPSAGWSPVQSVTTLAGTVVSGSAQPISAKVAAETVGVVTHQNFGAAPAVYRLASAVGQWVGHFNYRRMRSGLFTGHVSATEYVQFCRARGVKWDVPIYAANGQTSDSEAIAKMQWLAANAADVVGGFEGLNEPSHYFGATSTAEWMDAAVRCQQVIWDTRNSLPAVRHVPVLSSALHQKEAEDALAAGINWWEMLADRGLTRYFDVSALHSYGGSGGHPERRLDERIDRLKQYWPGKPVWVTETGYSDEWGHTTAEASGVAYGARIALAYVLRGVPVYNYELLDDAPGYGQDNLQRTFGVVATGTTDALAMNPANWTAKPVGRGLKSITDQWVEPAGTPSYTPNRVRCDITTSGSNVVSVLTARKEQSDAGTASCFLYRLADVGTLPVNVTVTDRVGVRTFSIGASPTRVDLR